jgi:hypothetical protein
MELQEAAMRTKRRPVRYMRRLAVHFSTAEGALPRAGCTFDLSANGMFLNTRALLPEGSHVLGRVALPDGAEAEVHGIVAWNRPTPRALNATARGGLGLRLVWADENYFEYLATSVL